MSDDNFNKYCEQLLVQYKRREYEGSYEASQERV